MSEDDEILQYPCEIAVKAMGRTDLDVDFEAVVVEIVRRHAPGIGEGAVTTRESRNGNYLSVTVRVIAESREQMDRIYQDLCDHDQVTMAL
jgi:putative lipoic acid-binding regulatory protein